MDAVALRCGTGVAFLNKGVFFSNAKCVLTKSQSAACFVQTRVDE